MRLEIFDLFINCSKYELFDIYNFEFYQLSMLQVTIKNFDLFIAS